MPSSLIVVALVVAWLVVLVPMVVRKRQEIARTADSALAARVVRSGAAAPDHPAAEEGRPVTALEPEDDGFTYTDDFSDDPAEDEPPAHPRRHRPGRGGFDPEAAARAAKAKYAFRQRVVLLMILAAVLTLVGAIALTGLLWWAHGLLDAALVGYLSYLRRQVRIEEDIRQRRQARMTAALAARRSHAHPVEPEDTDDEADDPDSEYEEPRRTPVQAVPRAVHPGATAVDLDDEDPWFDDLDDAPSLPYRRAVGE
ncbi:divisome protein SepX/GlpR [Actinokineospora bangkokensis]|uniref:Uncharacterized protein n=1 Tax=Actinokineospora bangkokensis TaxID=1193682 RepID=A0A1Q9LD48_9PSEU|nr:gephyrin-like molybdotransferase receptor GlpR [Actinokineospora bangkokensis]OLR89958.1 hypothetical protein BJP25_02940 [Actinokineospora bangkokensis]